MADTETREPLGDPHAPALEIEAERCTRSGRGTLSQEASKFTARGIPCYALHDPHFQSWVGKAVAYWEKLQATMARPAVKPASSRA